MRPEQARNEQRVAMQIIEGGGELTVQVPVPPKTLHPNGRAPWIAKAKDLKKFRQQAGDTAAGQVLQRYGGRPQFERAVIRLSYRLPAPRGGGIKPHDPDNLIAWAKGAIDALQDAGILADDRHVIYLPPSQSWTARDGTTDLPRLEIGVRKWEEDRCPFCDTTCE